MLLQLRVQRFLRWELIQGRCKIGKDYKRENPADALIHLLRTTSEAICSIAATLPSPPSSPSPERIAEGLGESLLEKSIAFLSQFTMRLG
jgi:hypothetical protein